MYPGSGGRDEVGTEMEMNSLMPGHPLPLPPAGCMGWTVDGSSVLLSGKQCTFSLPL